MGSAEDHKFGVHHYLDLLGGCLKRVMSEDDEESADSAFGTACHAWLHAYHTGVELPPLATVPPTDAKTGKPSGCSEDTLLKEYAKHFSPLGFGRTIWAETRQFGTLDVDGRAYPISGTADRITYMDDAAVALCETERKVILPGPGHYLNDFKTKKTKWATTIPQLLNGEQATMYEELAKQNAPQWHDDFQGTLFHLLYRHKAPDRDSFQTIFVPRADEDDLLRLKWIVKTATARLEREGKESVSPTRCFDFGRSCPLLPSCLRYNPLDFSSPQ